MEKLKEEINRKKMQMSQLSQNGSKYVRQKDLIDEAIKEKLAAQSKLDESRNLKRKYEDLPSSSNNEMSKGDIENGTKENEVAVNVWQTIEQIHQQLRLLGQPITLFGENIDDKRNRLTLMLKENKLSHDDDDFRLENLPNTFVAGQTGHQISKSNQNLNNDEDDDEDDDDKDDNDDEQNQQSSSSSNSNKNKRIEHVIYSRVPNLSQEKIVLKYFKSLLKIWEWDLNAREDYVKLSAKGKMETKTQKQCKDYIRPLFKLCKRKQVEYDILNALTEMVKCCEDGDFLKANDHYLRCAIGNAAWPIGLTMVGIHERSGREKISSSKVAHIMNNESQRKYLSSVKRLMTFAQSKRPDVPPSKKLLV